MVKDISPGPVSSGPNNSVDVDGTLFFLADDGLHGQELWKSDGTAQGTVMVKDGFSFDFHCPIAPSFCLFIKNLMNFDGQLFFEALDSTHGWELWRSDGTEEGTELVVDLFPGPGSSWPTSLTAYNGRLYFSAYDGTQEELWSTDGTREGTMLVQAMGDGPRPLGPSDFAEANGTLFFSAWDEVHGRELWKTDGTPEGTARVADIRQGSDHSRPENLVESGGELFFFADDGIHGEELWKSDGTRAGTRLVRDVRPGSLHFGLDQLVDAGGTLFFWAREGDRYNLWASDGTTEGTRRVSDVDPHRSAYYSPLIAVNERVFFVGYEDVHGAELWVSDGTEAGTFMIRDILPGKDSYGPSRLTAIGDSLLFAANDGTHGWELWKTDGLRETTTLVLDVSDRSGTSGSFAPLASVGYRRRKLAPSGDVVVFVPDDGVHGREPWRSDGTPDGTFLLEDILPGPLGGIWYYSTPVAAGDQVFFPAFEPETSSLGLWRSDGTKDGTLLVKDINPGFFGFSPGDFAEFDGDLFFSANVHPFGNELWRSDGTADGTYSVTNVNFRSSDPDNLIAAGDKLFFTATIRIDGQGDTEFLFRSDGSEAGTWAVAPIKTYGANTVASIDDDVFLVGARDSGIALWTSDGTEAGTVMVSDIYPGSSLFWPDDLTALGRSVLFSAKNEIYGRELWSSDGTATGTMLVRDIAPADADSEPELLTAVGDTLFFTADDGTHGRELWRSDGTANGTWMIQDIYPGPRGSEPRCLTAIDDSILFAAYNGVSGHELWKSDGTHDGTVRIQEIYAGPASSDPCGFTEVGNRVFFIADDGTTGMELWSGQTTILLNRPAEAIAELAVEIERLGLPKGVERSLIAKLDGARKHMKPGPIGAFMNHIEALRGNRISEPAADELLLFASDILGLVQTE